MKKSNYIFLGCLLVLGLTSCKKWLDVNTDKDNPNNQSVSIQNRVPWIEHFYQYTAGVTNYRTSCMAGVYYTNSTNPNTFSTTWACTNANSTTPYQTWFVEVSSNIVDLYNSAQAKGAYHYMAIADVFHALGYMEMLDLYGEMPYTQAGTGNPSPSPDDGKTIYYGCMSKLNEAISLFSRTQEAGAPQLSAGDLWSGGDLTKWIKLCWGLKARYMLKLSKKADLYNADSILYCLSKGPQSNADNTIGPGFNNSTVTDYLLGDPVVTNGNFDYAAYGSTNRISQYYYNLLTNLRSSGVVDPRMPKIVPASMANVQLDGSGKVSTYTWNRSTGVDSYNPQNSSAPLSLANRLVKGGPTSIATASYAASNTNIKYTIADATDRANFIAAQVAAGRTYTVSGNDVTVTYKAGSIYINSTNYIQAGDTVYVNLRSSALATSGIASQPANDVNWYPSLAAYNAGVIGSTGSFQVRPVSDQEILTYHEMCFIKAEVYMRKGDPANAYTAYRAGIQAHLDMMQAKLAQWKAGGYNKNAAGVTIPDMEPMDQTAINNYLTSSAVAQGAGLLTMSDIMLQKYIAMGCSIENWNDMRRFNFSAGNVGSYGVIYPGYQRGPLFTGQAQLTGGSPTDPRYWMRRWALPPVYEIQYNSIHTLALNAHAADPNIWSMPIWWDCATDAEYYGYLK
ncbi:SusD/RagB family nutrient-binding outer membrane lipoprotein [Flavisolibacter ginsenosidimutans]|uniref:SusD/RagB family nutrient-binding outer membrane lipoprotein n=1 Tax=Flavisolibacter ginsenosidimutans TaxID=661481 RepID=A0A5B8UHN7_9BACT|nr:SusD/RagB family nutrient-binding outer membrane lipoprotein [Flavisolibacter ginsenosidimutans]QEC55590.1 SusD/RagB family nutrient-binding outer membrane lipoprotein [Flavisolibacter ginsenosidimutans]